MSYLPVWNGIAEFVCIVETGSFTAAAQRLQVSTAQVSRQVNQLEQRLGVQLLHRTTRKVRVSETGQRYYQQCRQLMDGFEDAEQALQELQSTPKGKIRLTAPITYGERILMPLLIDFQENYPQLSLEVELTNARLDIVDSGLDLAIRLGRLEDSRLRFRKLASRNVYTCASPAYIQTYGQPSTLNQLKRHNCLLGSLGYWRFKDNGQERNITVNGSLRCNSGVSLLYAAEKALGIVQLPEEYVLDKIQQGQLVEVLAPYRPDSEGIWGLYPASRWTAPGVGLLLDYLQQHLPQSREDNPHQTDN
ncbi:LysR substrate-binding domain-containing protein [Bowmanella yangjiangensis]|uniref:LysR family transcriptional regulator n=1 Tax=Bowmanella yangjiangensis TaxID=2811230 RepID=A0ABS3CN33_9ALTE|nr:LysR substrate-binding domain-containing protein [Bowmanella yangjiangensis]MBN7818495.1 LysR family transcriptional regulator [Bowmanella yangjiangensis]